MRRSKLITDMLTSNEYQVGVEIGVCKGNLSRELLHLWGGKLFLVDSWRHIEGLVDINNPDHNGHLNNIAHTFQNVYIFGDRANIIRMLSSDASKLFQDESLDFVYIDAGHDYKSVMEDLKNWYPKIRKGGMLIGDDYMDGVLNNHTVFEVKKAVDEFFGETKVYSMDVEDSLTQFWIKK